jgi:hypothetical protein
VSTFDIGSRRPLRDPSSAIDRPPPRLGRWCPRQPASVNER